MPPLIQSERNRALSGRPVWIAGLYLAFSCIWILVTDRMLGSFSLSPEATIGWSIVKGFAYVGITSSIIYAIVRRLEESNQRLEQAVASRTAALAESEEESRAREEWLRRLLASLPDVAWTSAEDGQTIFISPNVEGIFGFSAEEICKSGEELWFGRIHPEDQQRVIEGFRALFGKGRPFDEEYRVQCKNGRWIWVHDRAVRTHREDGVLFADGIFSDVTERKEAERAREESEKRYRLLFERNLAGVFRADVDGKMLDCNPALVRMLGYDAAAELLGRPWAEILHDPAEEIVLLNNLTKSGAMNNVEIPLRRKDGSALWGLHNICLVEPWDGGSPSIEGTVVDVSERRQAVGALSQQLSLMQAITSTAPDGLFMLDAQGRVTYMNPAAERIFGYTMDEVQGRVLHDVCHYQRPDGSPLTQSECVIARAHTSGRPLYGHEDVNFRKDGTAFEVSCSAAPVFDGGKLKGSVLIVQDITERKQVEKQYRLLQQQFLHAQKMEAIGRLADGIAHEFNNLLQIINGYADLIGEQNDGHGGNGVNAVLAKRARAIKEAGDRAARLTRQLLTFSRKDANEPQITSLDRAIKAWMEMARTVTGDGIMLTTRLATKGECVKINGGQLEQLLMNLTVNARDAMPTGGRLLIATGCVQLDERACKAFGNIPAGQYVQVSVSDTGCGMDATTASRIFEPFFSTKERSKGTGLGLSTVYGIVTQNGGGIRVHSDLGVGTTFYICLPVIEPKVSLEEIKDRLEAPTGAGNGLEVL